MLPRLRAPDHHRSSTGLPERSSVRLRQVGWLLAALFALRAETLSAQTITFDTVSVSPGSCADATAYLASFGVTFVPVSTGASGTICNVAGTEITPASGANVFFGNPAATNNPVSYDLRFGQPLRQLTFTRVSVSGGISLPAWRATAYGASDQVLSSIDQGRLFPGPPEAMFALVGPGITRVRFEAFAQSTYNHPPFDDLVMSAIGGPPTWSRVTPAAPIAPPRGIAGSAYSAASNRLIVFGGYPQLTVYRNDLWILTNANGLGSSTWTQVIGNGTAGSPPPRGSATLNFDPTTNRAILVGGESTQLAVLSDVWVLLNADGTTGTPSWIQLAPQGSFPGRANHLAQYDPTTNRLIVTMGFFPGGNCRNTCITDPAETWVLENANGLGGTPRWIQLQTAGGPVGRASLQAASAYDPTTNRLFVFGGTRGNPGQNLGDLWVLDGANGVSGAPTWRQLPSGGPSPRYGATVFYNAAANRLGVFGGEDVTTAALFSDSWVLENADGLSGTPVWRPLAPGGRTAIGRSSSSVGYDAQRDRLIVSGGRVGALPDDQTWVLEGAITTGGTLRTPVVTVNPATYTFDGGPRQATATAVGQDGQAVAGTFAFTYTPGGETPPVNAGTYSVAAEFTSSDPTYGNASATGQLVIVPATPSVLVGGGPFTYDAQSHAATVTVTGISGAAVSGTVSVTYTPGGAAAPVNAGSYAVAASFTSSDQNYTGGSATGTIVITKAVPTLQIVGGTFVFDGLPHAATATATGATGTVPGSIVITYIPGGTAAPILIGNYAVAAVFTSTDTNYVDTTASAAISIAPSSPLATLTVETAEPAYRRGQPVLITGQVLSSDGTGIANVQVSLTVSGNGVNRSARPFSDAQGVFRYTFQPSATDGGLFTASVSLSLGGVTRTASAVFHLVGILAPSTLEKADLVMGTDLVLPIALRNVGARALSSVSFTVEVLPAGAVAVSLPAVISSFAGGESVTAAVGVSAPQGTPPTGPVGVTVRISSTDSVTGLVSGETVSSVLTLRPATRTPVIEPPALAVGANPGRAITRRFQVRNDGYQTMTGAYASLRDASTTPWISLGNSALGDLGPGEFREVAVRIAPPADLPRAVYSVHLDVFGGDTPVSAAIQVAVTDSVLGEVSVTVNNDLGSRVPGATVTLYGSTGAVFQAVAGVDGVASLSGVSAGTYTYFAAAPGHTTTSSTVAVTANTTTPVSVLLSYDVVTLSFTVTPTTIVDQYNVTLNILYSTTLPKPALQVVPYALQLRFFSEDAANGFYACKLSVTNSHPTAPVRNVTIDASQLDVESPAGERLRISFADGSTVFDAGNLMARATTEVPCLASLDGTSVPTHAVGSILVSANYDFSLDGQLLVGTTTTKVPVSYLRPDDLSFAAIQYTYDKRTDPANPILRYEEGTSFLKTVRSNRPLTLDFLRPGPPFNGRNLVAFTDTVGGTSSLAVINANASRAFWRGDLNAAKQTLVGVGDVTTFDISTLDPPGAGGVSLEDAIRAQIAINEVQITSQPSYLGMAGQWSDATSPVGFLVPIQITTLLPASIQVPRPITSGGIGCLNPEDQYCDDPSDEIGPPSVATDGQIRLAIEQKVRLERQAFDAFLGIGTTAQLTNVTATVRVTDTQGSDASGQFFTIVASDPSGATRGGALTGQASVAWQLIPSATAGGTAATGTPYDVQVHFTYAVDGVPRSAVTQRVRITVLPSPRLTLHYTVPYVVVAGKPAKLRVRAENLGSGTARNLTIESAQPRVIERIPEGGIDPFDEVVGPLVDFTITGSSNTFDGSTFEEGQLTVPFGDVPPAAIKDGYWTLDVSRRGYFIDVAATMRHQDYRGLRLDPLVLPPTIALVPAVGGMVTGGAANVGLPALTVSLSRDGALVGSDTTNGQGVYYITDLAPGPYDLEVRDLAGVVLLTRSIVVLDQQATDFIDITLPTYDPTLAVVVVRSAIPGASFTADGVPYTTPQSFVWPIGSSHVIEARPTAQGEQQFVGWSDGETSPTRSIAVSSLGQTVTLLHRSAAEVSAYSRQQLTFDLRDHRWPSTNSFGDLVWSERENGLWQVFKKPAPGRVDCTLNVRGTCQITGDAHNHERPTIADDGSIAWFQDTTGSGLGYVVMKLGRGSETPSIVEFSSRSRPECNPATGTCFTPRERVAGKTFGMDSTARTLSSFTFYENGRAVYGRFNLTGAGALPGDGSPPDNLVGHDAPDINVVDQVVFGDALMPGAPTASRAVWIATKSDPMSRARIGDGQFPRIADGSGPQVVFVADGNAIMHWIGDGAPARWAATGVWADIVRLDASTTVVYECRVSGYSQICVGVEHSQDTDTDDDDVNDDVDRCPGTPAGATVNANGCHLEMTLSMSACGTGGCRMPPSSYASPPLGGPLPGTSISSVLAAVRRVDGVPVVEPIHVRFEISQADLTAIGHSHSGSPLPIGTFVNLATNPAVAIDSCSTQDGSCQLSFIAPEVSQASSIRAYLNDTPAVQDVKHLTVAIDGLSTLGPGVGYDVTAPTGGQTAAHPDNHYGTQTLLDAIV